jgi:hypothetical protein
VNILGHASVALACGRDDAGYVLGAVLPDLAPMAGVRVARAGLDGALGAGVRCHLAADAAFHAHPHFRAGSAELRRALARRGVGTGPARAIGHAGWELLLDGTLVGMPAEDAFHAALGAGDQVLPALAPEDRPRWATFLARARSAGPLRYDEPRWVAERLHAMLARRPRLRLPDDRLDTVTEELAGRVAAVAAVAAAVVDDTSRATAASDGIHRTRR